MSLESMLNTSITLVRHTITKDTSGGQRRVTSEIGPFAASVQPLTGRERQAFRQRMIYVSHKIYTAVDTGVARGDVVKDAAGKRYVVKGFEDMAGRMRAYCIQASLQTD